MGRFFDLAVLLFGFQAVAVWGKDEIDNADPVENPSHSPALAVTATASFPDAEIFGIKIVNGKLSEVTLSFHNEEPKPVTVQFVGGSLWTPDFDPTGPRIVRNLTTRQYAVEIPAGEKQTVPYSFQTNMHPQELRLNLAAVVMKESSFFNIPAFNGTIAVVEPDTSIFDPQIIFLYLFLLVATGGVGYFFYAVWISPYFPQKKRATRKTPSAKKVEPVDQVVDGPAISTGAKSYNEDWIPASHLQRPEARRVKSGGRPKSRQGKE